MDTSIINEYDILKRIFSSLNHRDLYSASKVCREWDRVSKIVANQNGALPILFRKSGASWPEVDCIVHPQLILHMKSSRRPKGKIKGAALWDWLSSKIFLQHPEMHFVSVYVWKPICYPNQSEPKSAAKNTNECVIMLPQSNYLKVSVTYLTKASAETDIMNCVSNSSSVIMMSTDSELQDDLFRHLVESRVNGLLVGGLALVVGINEERETSRGCLGVLISFSGKLVSSHIDCLINYKKMPAFFQKLKEDAGVIPPDHSRIVYRFTCINKLSKEEAEIQEFRKVFPTEPVYGYWSLGELFYSGAPIKKRRLDNELTRTPCCSDCIKSDTSCYLILTFKN